ncbi:MAG: tripartite tricarboxylate transporter substrate binding protein [Betaproteobacteria bacterium]|nr:MAG: tripartite tricarboxylate transporter substrate binding protein [Betaproteobacteria bacterium]
MPVALHATPRDLMRRLIAIIATLLPWLACAQSGYPSRPIRLIVPYPPGAGTDIVARTVGPKLGELLGQQVVVENRGGAAGVIGTDLVAKSAPDGYTVGLITGSFAMTPSLVKLPYDPIKDFTPLSTLASVQNILLVHPSLPVGNVQELIRFVRARPGQLTYATSGTGGVGHLAMELMRMKVTGLDVVHVPYKGNAPALTDLVGGHVTMMFVALPSAKPFLSPPRVRPLAVTGSRRAMAVPDVPTMHEAGVTGYAYSSDFGLVLPARTPREIVARLSGELLRVLKMPEVRDRLAAAGTEPAGNLPEEYAQMIRADIAKWAQVVKAAGIKAE